MRGAQVMIAAAVLGLIGLSSCASAPSYQVASARFPRLGPGMGRIIFYRPPYRSNEDLPLAAGQPVIELNRDEVGMALPNAFFFVDKPVGTYVVHGWRQHDLSLVLHNQEVLYVRYPPWDYYAYPALVYASEAQREMKQCVYDGRIALAETSAQTIGQ